jgi:tripartite-type tricarboxylate transporter receptor subunit TctC
MRLPRRRFPRLAAGTAALTLTSFVVLSLTGNDAQSQTARTIKLVVPFAAGGPTDLLARLLAEQIGRAQGRTVVVENRPGAGSVIGTEAVSRATPDGETVLIASSAFVVLPHLRKLNYDPLTSFEPICQLVSFPPVIVVSNASPYRTLADLLDAARAKPGGLTLASLGPGSASQIGVEMLKRAAKADIAFIPYPGYAPAINALLGEHVTSVLADYSGVAEQLKAGKLRALATTSRTRIEPLPDVPTVVESGYKDYELDIWNGVLAPAKTPKETASRLAGWFTAALQAPEVNSKLVAQGIYPVGVCGSNFATLLRKQFDDFGRVIREANITAE